MSGHRKAALALHVLAPEDQHAVLAELPEADQQILRTYLAELTELGFAGEAVDAVLTDRPSADPRHIVARAAPAAVLEVLGHEPASFIVALLQVEHWPWESDVLAALPAQLRLRVETRRAASASDATARNAFVVRVLAQALGGRPAVQKAAPVMRRLANPFKRITAWSR